MAKKIILTLFALLIIIIVLFGAIIFTVIDYDEANNSVTINLKEEDKSLLKKAALKIKDWVYREATINNPEGDVLPDELDDKILEEIKNKIN